MKVLAHNGFTLLEMIIVLSIVSIFTLVITFSSAYVIQTFNEKNLLHELKATIIYTQLYALTNQEDTSIQFNPETKSFISMTNKNTTKTTVLDPYLKINSNKAIIFRFSGETGNIDRFRSVLLEGASRHYYRFIFQIGKGRFRIETT